MLIYICELLTIHRYSKPGLCGILLEKLFGTEFYLIVL